MVINFFFSHFEKQSSQILKETFTINKESHVFKKINNSFTHLILIANLNDKRLQNSFKWNHFKKTEKTQNLDSLILNLNSKALQLAKNRDFDLANETVQLSISLSKNRELTKMLMKSYNTLGLISYLEFNYHSAFLNFSKQLSIAKRLNDTHSILSAKTNLGLIYNQIGNYSTAIKFHENSLIIANRIKDYDKLALNLMALGDLYTKTNNTTVAEKYLKYAIEIYETKTTSKELQNAYYYLASYNTVSLHFKESNKIIVDCLPKVDTLDFNLLGNFYVLHATNYDSLNNAEKSILNLKKALNYYNKSKNNNGLYNVYAKLTDLYLSKDSIVASKMLKNKIYYLDIASNEDKLNNFYFSQINSKIKNLELTKNQEAKSNRRFRLIFLSLTIAISIFIIALFLYKKNKRIHDVYKRVAFSNEVKSNFLNNITQELVLPLNIIEENTGQFKTSDLTDEQKIYIQNIQNAARSLKSMTTDIYDFNEHKREKQSLKIEQHNIFDVINDSFESLKLEASTKSILYNKNVTNDLSCLLYFDKLKVQQVILNLLKNAIKFTDEGTVTLNVKIKKQHELYYDVLFEVIDTGRGIKMENIPNIFDEFYQEDSDFTRKYYGTGLGLSISQKIIQLMGSTIKVESNEGKGSKFYFIIKLNKAI